MRERIARRFLSLLITNSNNSPSVLITIIFEKKGGELEGRMGGGKKGEEQGENRRVGWEEEKNGRKREG